MKVLLRNKKTRLYASATGQWLKDRMEAHNFGKGLQAYEHAKEYLLEDAEVVFVYDDHTDAFTLPARSFSPAPIRINDPAEAVRLALGDDLARAKTLSITPSKLL